MTEIKQKKYEIGSAWEEFKSCNDQRLDSLKKTNASDPLYEEKLQRINTELDKYKQEISDLKASIKTQTTEDKEKKDFIQYLKTGKLSMEQKAFHTGSPITEGFHLISPDKEREIRNLLLDRSPMRQLSSIQTSTNNTDTEVINLEQDGLEAKWLTRNTISTETTTSTFETKIIYSYTLYAEPKAEQKLLEDAEVDLEAWILERVIDAFSVLENESFINGDSGLEPRGILSYGINIDEFNSGINGQITADSLLNLYHELKSIYAANATFLMHRTAIQQVRLLKDTANRYIWEPGLETKGDTLFGIPLRTAVDMPVPATNSLSVAIADFKSAYRIVDRMGIKIIRDAFTEKPFVKFFITKRVGGAVIRLDAIKLLKLAA